MTLLARIKNHPKLSIFSTPKSWGDDMKTLLLAISTVLMLYSGYKLPPNCPRDNCMLLATQQPTIYQCPCCGTKYQVIE